MISMRIFIEEDGVRGKLQLVEEIGWRGYVFVPPSSNLRRLPVDMGLDVELWEEQGCDDVNVVVGGITYTNGGIEVGFDCCHEGVHRFDLDFARTELTKLMAWVKSKGTHDLSEEATRVETHARLRQMYETSENPWNPPLLLFNAEEEAALFKTYFEE